jgi:uncharacterized protein YjlB
MGCGEGFAGFRFGPGDVVVVGESGGVGKIIGMNSADGDIREGAVPGRSYEVQSLLSSRVERIHEHLAYSLDDAIAKNKIHRQYMTDIYEHLASKRDELDRVMKKLAWALTK